MKLTLYLDDDTRRRLMAAAQDEHRPLAFQAEVILRRSLGLPLANEAEPERNGRELVTAASGHEPDRAA